jgi:hypothetical protein
MIPAWRLHPRFLSLRDCPPVRSLDKHKQVGPVTQTVGEGLRLTHISSLSPPTITVSSVASQVSQPFLDIRASRKRDGLATNRQKQQQRSPHPQSRRLPRPSVIARLATPTSSPLAPGVAVLFPLEPVPWLSTSPRSSSKRRSVLDFR